MWVITMILIMIILAGLQQPSARKAQRLPLQKKKLVLTSPLHYPKRLLRIDPSTGGEIYYDHKPRIVVIDVKSGKYALKWIGYDGNEKSVVYQRPDALDVVVSALVSKTASGQYLYSYTIASLPGSVEPLTGFVVQNFASDVKPVKMADVYIGEMTKNVNEFKEGNWVSFGLLPTFKPTVSHGASVEFKLQSSAPAGLVECRVVGGSQGMIVVGEEPPTELLDLLPGYEAWPHGYTIGPVEGLKALSPGKRAEYVRQRLSQFQRLGWMTADVVPWYERNLKGDNLEAVVKRAEQDLKAEKITTEVLGMIQAIR